MEEQTYMKLSKSFKLLCICAAVAAASNVANAAFIDASIGDAIVVNASAVYYNPAILSIFRRNELVVYGAESLVNFQFKGTATQRATGYSQTGSTSSNTSYFLPSVYLAIPIADKVTLGFGQTYTYYGLSNYPPNSILRYVGTKSYISVIDLMASIGFKISEHMALGAGLDFELGNLILNSMVGFPSLGVADVLSHNQASGIGYGSHFGLAYAPIRGTAIGLTYHTSVTTNFEGNSTFQSTTPFNTNRFKTTITAPASTVLSVDQYVNPKLGFMGTIQYTWWNSVRQIRLQNIAVVSSGVNVIVPLTLSNYFLHNTWRYSLGAHYQANPKWQFRAGASYDSDPENPTASVGAGDYVSFILGIGYHFTKDVNFDFNYGHTYYKTANINIVGTNNVVGKTTGGRDGVSARLTWDF